MLQLQRRFGDQDDGGGEGDAVVKKKPLLNLSPPAQVLLHHHHHTCHYCDNQPRLPPPPPPKTPENHRLPPSPMATAAAATITTTSSSILDDRLDCRHCDGDDAVQYSSPLRRRSNHRLAHLDASDCRRRSCCSSSSSCTAAPDRSTSVDVVSGCKPQSTRTALTVQAAKAAEAQLTSTTQIQTATTSYYRVHQLTQTSSSHLNNCLGLCDVIMLSKRKRRKGEEEEMATGGVRLSRTSPTPTSSSVLPPLKPPPSRVSSLPLSLFSFMSSSSSTSTSTSTSSSSSQLTTTYLCRRLLLFLFCLFTVISASSSFAFAYSSSSSHINGGSYRHFDHLQQTGGGEFPPYYSQYYPPYLVEDVRIQPAPTRQGKSRPLAKAPSVPAARLYLDPATFTGGEVTGHAVLRRRNPGGSTPQTFDMSDSDQLQQPDYLITGDIFVPPGARLEIEPGVRIAFAPRVGLTVRGSLLANVSNKLLTLLTLPILLLLLLYSPLCATFILARARLARV